MNQQILALIEKHAAGLGQYHAARFTKTVTKTIQRQPELATDDFISGAAAYWAHVVAEELARILAIDAALATMPPGFEALADAAKYQHFLSADDFVQAAMRGYGNATQVLSRTRRDGDPGRR